MFHFFLILFVSTKSINGVTGNVNVCMGPGSSHRLDSCSSRGETDSCNSFFDYNMLYEKWIVTWICNCDAECMRYNDCCYDYQDVCQNESMSIKTLDSLEKCIKPNDVTNTGIWMVAKCSESWEDSSDRDNCENDVPSGKFDTIDEYKLNIIPGRFVFKSIRQTWT